MCKLEEYKHLELTNEHRIMLTTELDEWHKTYIPPTGIGVIGKTVLDLGAGCGETAQFFLLHGAYHVICIESGILALQNLYKNFGKDNRVTIIPKHIDLEKIDIEGSEEWLTVETHFPTSFKKIAKNTNDRQVNTYRIERSQFSITSIIDNVFDSINYTIHSLRIKTAHMIRLLLDLW